jgi:electron transport complex protein RnfA
MILIAGLLAGCGSEGDHRFIQKAVFDGESRVILQFAGPVDPQWAENPAAYTMTEEPDPDIRLALAGVQLQPDRNTVILTFSEPLNQNRTHILKIADIQSRGESLGPAVVRVKKLYFGYLFSILLGAMVIQNFVFTKYLGLCVFFGTSQRKATAVGMGITFTIVMVFSAMMAWFLYQFVLRPYRLDFLQVVVFIGLVSLSVQAVDTILRKINPALFKAFGVYLVLVIANCIIIAVPLILADNDYNAWESLMLALGAGLGFLIALFLMSSARERLELANVPPSYRGLPIAFVVAGLFALAFMGFSGMSLF